MRTYPGDVFLAVVVLMPILVALPAFSAPWEWSWIGISSALATSTGIGAFSTFLAAAMLSARIPGTDRWFGGQVRLWQLHRLLGTAAFLLAMAHVLFLVFSALPLSVQHSMDLIFPGLTQGEIWVGWAAFLVMVVFVTPAFSFFINLPYQTWKRLHGLSAVALVFAALHVLVLSPTPGIWWLLTAMAIAAILWRKVLSPFLARKAYRVDKVEQLTRDVVEISLRPVGKGIRWRAGQFVYLTPMDPSLSAGYKEEHPYTISSSSREETLRIGIKAVGDATNALLSIKSGADVRIEGPYGTFFEARAPKRKQLWVGGGIGITPFVAGAREIQAGDAQRSDIALFYLANRPERAYYLDELEGIASVSEGFAVHRHYKHQEGLLSTEFLATHCPDFSEREVYLCGPPGMICHVTALLRQEGVPPHLIHTEVFDFL